MSVHERVTVPRVGDRIPLFQIPPRRSINGRLRYIVASGERARHIARPAREVGLIGNALQDHSHARAHSPQGHSPQFHRLSIEDEVLRPQ